MKANNIDAPISKEQLKWEFRQPKIGQSHRRSIILKIIFWGYYNIFRKNLCKNKIGQGQKYQYFVTLDRHYLHYINHATLSQLTVKKTFNIRLEKTYYILPKRWLNLVQDLRETRQETNCLDPLIYQNPHILAKCHILLLYTAMLRLLRFFVIVHVYLQLLKNIFSN